MAKKKTAGGRNPKDDSGKTQGQLAAEAGVNLSTWKRWEAEKALGGADLVDNKRQAEIKRIDTEREKTALYMAIAKMEYLPKRDLEIALALIAAVADQQDSAMLSELPAVLDGCSAAETQIRLGEFVDEWKEERANAHSAAWDAARTAITKTIRGELKKVAGSKGTA